MGGLSACGTYEVQSTPPEVVSPEMAPYVADFYEYIKDIGLGAQTYPVESVTFNSVAAFQEGHKATVIGVCLTGNTYRGSFGSKVVIDPSFWDMASEGARYTIVFHELIHCSLRRHLRKHPDGGLMNASIPSPEMSMMEFRQLVRNYFEQ